MPRFQAKIKSIGKALFPVTLFLITSLWIGCGSSDNPNLYAGGDPKGTFYSLAVSNRFDTGQDAQKAIGKELYLSYCAVCHGESGDGQGLNAYNLKSQFGVQPLNFTDSAASSRISYDEVTKAIRGGGAAVNKSQYMHPWGATFSEYDLACLADYVWFGLMKMKDKK